MRDVPHPLSTVGLAAYDFAITDSLTFNLPGSHHHDLRGQGAPEERSPAPHHRRDVHRARRRAGRPDGVQLHARRVHRQRARGSVRRHREQPRQLPLLAPAPAGDRDPARRHVARLSRFAASSAAAGSSATTRSTPDSPRRSSAARRSSSRRRRCRTPFTSAAASSTRSRPMCAPSPTPTSSACRRRRARSSAPRRSAARRRSPSPPSASPTSSASTAPRDSPSAPASASRFGGGFGIEARGRYGVDDKLGKGSGTLSWQSPKWGVRLFGQSDFRDAGDIQERSLLVNSIAAQEFGVRLHRSLRRARRRHRLRRTRHRAASASISTRRSSASGRCG